jgi:hypothetical protein
MINPSTNLKSIKEERRKGARKTASGEPAEEDTQENLERRVAHGAAHAVEGDQEVGRADAEESADSTYIHHASRFGESASTTTIVSRVLTWPVYPLGTGPT